MLFDADTIVAISTAPGRGGIGIVRLSGPDAQAIAEPLLRLRHPLAAGHARFGHMLDADGTVLDEAVATLFRAPHSYTAEDVVEIACHGSPVLLDYVVRACLARGARLADPGEFTQRAFLAGRLDLTQAEAVNDLIASQTLHQAQLAARQLGGAVARSLAPTKDLLVALIAELEAGIDFAEDDLDVLPQAAIATRIGDIQAQLEPLANTYRYGRIVREGFTLAIVGRPNAGKSSLFNRLLERERAIVTAQPGTTRDPISERLAIGGIPVELIDTAGLRDQPEGDAEAQGIARSRTAMADADFVILVTDAAEPTPNSNSGAPPLASEMWDGPAPFHGLEARPSILVRNKCDLLATREPFAGLYTSAKTGEGIDALKGAILESLAATPSTADSALLTNLRQHEALLAALAELDRAASAVALPHELLLLDLHAALEALDRLTGTTTSDSILKLIFSRFCIGK